MSLDEHSLGAFRNITSYMLACKIAGGDSTNDLRCRRFWLEEPVAEPTAAPQAAPQAQPIAPVAAPVKSPSKKSVSTSLLSATTETTFLILYAVVVAMN